MRAPAAPPRPQSVVSWSGLLLLALLSLTLWFVTTFVVLLPLLLANPAAQNQRASAEHRRRPEGLAGEDGLSRVVATLMLLVFQLFFALYALSAARTVLTAPGDIPSWLLSDGTSDLHSYSNLLQAVERKRDSAPRFCRKTGAYKPDRAHYCSQVRRCVLQFQTFSAPLNSAIGFYNYKFYLLASFYGALCAAWVVATTLPEVIGSGSRQWAAPQWAQVAGAPLRHDDLSTGSLLFSQLQAVGQFVSRGDVPSQWVVDVTILLTLVLAALALLPTAYTLCLHLRLIAIGRTYHEWRLLRSGKRRQGSRSLFDYGAQTRPRLLGRPWLARPRLTRPRAARRPSPNLAGTLNNFALTLGIYPLLWLMPTRSGIEGNGIFFPEQERALFMH